MRGHFIVLEGVDGCGKTTQMQFLHKWLNDVSVPHVITREPGGVACADAMRGLLAQSGSAWSPMGQALLLNAGRVEHTMQLIEPNLASGTHVLSDRYVDSTLAYQGGGDKSVVDQLLALHKIAIGDVFPDLTLWLDVDESVAYERLKRRAQQGMTHDFEKKSSMQKKARNGYIYLQDRFPERFVRVDANRSKSDILSSIKEHINKLVE